MREERTEVLVVGAGPVGLFTALMLAEAGIDFSIIDCETKTAARSYACALHPQTLKLLQRFGLADAVLDVGRRVGTMAFYEGESRRAELSFAQSAPEFPILVILPQNTFERLLEQRLAKAGIKVQWNHRFDSLTKAQETVLANIEELSGTGTGYIIPHWEAVVANRSQLQVQFLLGADGHNSIVRQRLGVDYHRVGEPEAFAAFEFETNSPGPDEVRVALSDTTTNVLWPLPENKCRWTFQLVRAEFSEFPEKERRAVRLAQDAVDERIREYVLRVAQRRAPWFSPNLKRISWCTEVSFQHRMVTEFGRERCWLLGDAAHQTGPVGVQSMNLGFLEAEQLTGLIRSVLRDGADPNCMSEYNRKQQSTWRTMLGIGGGLRPQAQATDWVSKHASRLLPCLPASGKELDALARQIGLELRTLEKAEKPLRANV